MGVDWPDLRPQEKELVARLAAGETVPVTRSGRLVARLVPAGELRRPWVVGVCGASGVGYAAALLRGLAHAGEAVDLVVTRAGRLTILDETGVAFRESSWQSDLLAWTSDCGHPVDVAGADVRCWAPGDFTAGPASGSYPSRGMVVVPATSAAVAGIAEGLSKDLVQRAAEVMLKERRPLVVVPREAPLTRATLRHLLSLDEMGAVVLPASPGFYAGVRSVPALYAFVAAKVLDVLGVPQSLMRRWEGTVGAARSAEDVARPDPSTAAPLP